MRNRLPVALLLLIVLGLAGCATMSGDECLTGDWYAIGYEDGSKGHQATRLGEHRKACAKHGVTPDFAAYHTGHDEGLDYFCQRSRGFSLGSNGGTYNGVCAAHREADFIDAYNSGRHLFDLRSRVDDANGQIQSRQDTLEENRELMQDKEVMVIAADTSTEERIRMLAELKDLAEANGQLEAEIRQLIEELAQHEHALADYEAMLVDFGF